MLGRDRVLHLIATDNHRSAEVAKRLGAAPIGEAEVMGVPVVVWASERGAD